MLYSSIRRVMLAFVVASVTVASSVSWHSPQIAFASDPCDAVASDPNPPIGPPVPHIGGTVLNSSTVAPIQGATINLYSCDGGDPDYVSQTATDSQGNYVFSGIADQTFYYVEAVMSGSLAGMTPTGATVNPTAAIGIGNSVSNVNFTFQ